MQRAEPKRPVRRHRNALVRGFPRLQNDMASGLVNSLVTPASAERLGQVLTGQAAGDFHATERTSSRTRCSRILLGGVPSK